MRSRGNLSEGSYQGRSDFISFQWNKFIVGIDLVELRTKIHCMDSWVVSLQNEVMFYAHENIVFLDNFSFQCGPGNSELLGRRTDDGPGLQNNDPIGLADIVWMNGYVVTWDFSSEDTHFTRCPLAKGPTRSGATHSKSNL